MLRITHPPSPLPTPSEPTFFLPIFQIYSLHLIIWLPHTMFTKRLALKSFYFSLDNWWSYCANLHIFRWRSHIRSNTISFPLLSLISCHFTPFFCLISPPYSSSLFWFSTVYYLLRPTLPPPYPFPPQFYFDPLVWSEHETASHPDPKW